jgi:hypothetical protein
MQLSRSPEKALLDLTRLRKKALDGGFTIEGRRSVLQNFKDAGSETLHEKAKERLFALQVFSPIQATRWLK